MGSSQPSQTKCFKKCEKYQKNIYYFCEETISFFSIQNYKSDLTVIQSIKIFYLGKMIHRNGIPTIEQLLSQGININQAREILLQYRPTPSHFPTGGAYQLVQTLLRDRSCYDEPYHWVRFLEAGLISLPRRNTLVEQLLQVIELIIRYKQNTVLTDRNFTCCMVFTYYRCWRVSKGCNWGLMYEQFARCLEHAFQTLQKDHSWFEKNLSFFQSEDGTFSNVRLESK